MQFQVHINIFKFNLVVTKLYELEAKVRGITHVNRDKKVKPCCEHVWYMYM